MARTKEDIPPHAPTGWDSYFECAICGQVTFYVGDDFYVNGTKAEHCNCFNNFNSGEDTDE